MAEMTNVYITTTDGGYGCCLWQLIKGVIALIVVLVGLVACCGTYGAMSVALF